jgi:type IV secretion system protein VirB9
MTPSTAGYRDGHSVVQRYPYIPGQLYEVYSAPKRPTTIIFPPGEYLAIGPDIDDQNSWDVAEGEMGEGVTYQQFVKIRPLVAGLDHTTTFMMQSGLILPVRLRSFPQTSMVVVTWEMPRRPVALLGKPLPRQPAFRTRQREEEATPKIDPARLHTAYTIETTKGTPPWVPLAVYDDGTKTVIQFKESLGYTQAPAPFALDADGTMALVQFIPYQVPGEPSKGTFYIVQGLWPKLELRGDGGMVVTIKRQTGKAAPYQPAKEPNS